MDFGKIDRIVRTLRPRAKPYDHALGSSMSCRVTADGGRALYLRIEVRGKQQRFKLGYYPATTIAAAHAKAMEIRSQIKNGIDPRVEARRAGRGADAPATINDAVERFIAEHVKVKNREGWATEVERLLRTEVLPRIGSYPLSQLKRTDLASLIAAKAVALRAKKRTGTIANRISTVIGKFMNFSAQHGWVSYDLGRGLPKPILEKPKKRVLTPTELGELWHELQSVRLGQGTTQPVYGSIIALLAVSGARCSEITSLRCGAVDKEGGTITITNGKTEASNRTLTLPPVARSIIEGQMSAANESDDLLFPLPNGGLVPSNEVSRAARKIVKALGHQSWTPHDLRRTVVSIMAELGVDGDIGRRITGHQAQDVHGRVYDQAVRQNAVRAALLEVQEHVLAAARKVAAAVPPNVVSILRK